MVELLRGIEFLVLRLSTVEEDDVSLAGFFFAKGDEMRLCLVEIEGNSNLSPIFNPISKTSGSGSEVRRRRDCGTKLQQGWHFPDACLLFCFWKIAISIVFISDIFLFVFIFI